MDLSIPNDFKHIDYIKKEQPDILELISIGIWATKLIKKQKLIIITNEEDNDGLQHGQDKVLQDIRHEIISLTSLVGGGTAKGKITERIILDKLTQYFPSAEIDDTGYTAGVGDISVIYKNVKIMIEVKNYTKNVPRSEQEKFIRDLTENKFDAGIIVSCSSGIANRPSQLEYEMINGKFTVYLSNAGIEGGAIAWAILFITAAKQFLSNISKIDDEKIKLIFLQIKSELVPIESCISNNMKINSLLATMPKRIARTVENQIKPIIQLIDSGDIQLQLVIDNFTKLLESKTMPITMSVLNLDSKDNPSLESMKVSQLRTIAKEKNIDIKGLKKKELIAAIRNA